VQEEGGKVEDADINKGHGGKYVWIVPLYTDDKAKAAIGFNFVKRTAEDQFSWTNRDLAEGAGGNYRYLVPERQRDDHSEDGFPILSLSLKREGTLTQWMQTGEDGLIGGKFKQAVIDGEYRGHSGDINAGRGGDYLFLCYTVDYAQ